MFLFKTLHTLCNLPNKLASKGSTSLLSHIDLLIKKELAGEKAIALTVENILRLALA